MATKNSKRFRLQFENLESRLLLHGGDLGDALDHDGAGAATLIAAARMNERVTDFNFTDALAEEAIDRRMGLPVLNSNPGAAVTLHLDFTGNFERTWFWLNLDGTLGGYYEDAVTPVYDLDEHPEAFNAEEQALILEVWQRVSEDFAPFNINVTTAYYGTYENGEALKVAIGGSPNDWLGILSGGIASIGSFTDEAPNVVFVFNRSIEQGFDFEASLANTASHEAGHAFGLLHQHEYDADGNSIAVYSKGTGVWTPLMGYTHCDDRTTWAAGGVGDQDDVTQDELAVLTGADNGFGYRPDDHGNTRATASSFSYSPYTTASASGIIEKMNDVDVFSFYTAGGNIRVGINVVEVGPNLDAKIELRDSKGRLLAQADRRDELSATIQYTVSAGTYYLHVLSHGTYGDLGQYTAYRTLNVPKDPLSPISKVSLDLVGPKLGASNGLAADKKVGVNVPPVAPPTLSSQVSTVSLMVPATGVSSPALPSAKPLIAAASSRSNIAPRSVKAVTSTAAIDHVFAMGLDKLGKLF